MFKPVFCDVGVDTTHEREREREWSREVVAVVRWGGRVVVPDNGGCHRHEMVERVCSLVGGARW